MTSVVEFAVTAYAGRAEGLPRWPAVNLQFGYSIAVAFLNRLRGPVSAEDRAPFVVEFKWCQSTAVGQHGDEGMHHGVASVWHMIARRIMPRVIQSMGLFAI